MDRVAAEQAGPFLFLAEGLLMYLPPDGVKALILGLESRFPGSELVCDAAASFWLKPPLKWINRAKARYYHFPGLDVQSGIRDSREFETWSPGLRRLEEWNILDEDDPRLGVWRRLRNWKLIRHYYGGGWTMRYRLGPKDAPK